MLFSFHQYKRRGWLIIPDIQLVKKSVKAHLTAENQADFVAPL